MKKFILLCSMVWASSSVFAQAWSAKGDQKAQVGFNGWGYGTGITGVYDYGLGNIVSVGAGVNLYFDGYKGDDKAFVFGRVGFHLQEPLDLPEQWDVYPGVNVGLLGSGFGLGAHIGVRYFFNEKIGVYGEFGNNGSFGVSFSF